MFVKIRRFHVVILAAGACSIFFLMFTFLPSDIKISTSHDSKLESNSQHDIACRSIDEISNGYWRLQTDLTRYEIEERKRLDSGNRIAMNWPAHLYRNDSRCGQFFPVPGYRLLAQCNPESDSPCCNMESGWCGSSPSHCICDHCTDHRTMIPAEIGEWVPRTCYFHYFHQSDMCSLLSRYNISLTFTGDSLIRHLHTMALLTLTDDFIEGSLPSQATAKQRSLCRGESQITNKICSVEVASKTVKQLVNNTVCNGDIQSLTIDLVQDYHRQLIPEVRQKLLDIRNCLNHWLIAGVGLHYQLNFSDVKLKYLDKIWEILQKSSNGWPKLLWINIHGIHGFLRMKTGPGNDRIKRFNRKVTEYWSTRNVTVIETFNMSEGLQSYDGRHYGFGFNKLKWNVILQHLYHHYSND